MQQSPGHLSVGVDDVHRRDAGQLAHVLDGCPLPVPDGGLQQEPLQLLPLPVLVARQLRHNEGGVTGV